MLLICCSLVKGYDEDFIHVYMSPSESRYNLYKMNNETSEMFNRYITVYSDSNISLYRNSVSEQNTSVLMYFEIFEYDNITLYTNSSYFWFFVTEVTDEDIVFEGYVSDLGDKSFFKLIGRLEILVGVICGAALTFLGGYLWYRKR